LPALATERRKVLQIDELASIRADRRAGPRERATLPLAGAEAVCQRGRPSCTTDVEAADLHTGAGAPLATPAPMIV